MVSLLEPADLARPTPCDGWMVYDLLAHMTGQQIGFAAAARGGGADLGVWAPSDASYADACADVLTAFAEPGVAERGFSLPEIRSGGTFPAPLAISFHLVDNVVHAWDVAVSIGARVDLADGVVSAALRVAEQVPDGTERLLTGAAFAPGRPVDGGASELDRILLLLGRAPGWPS